MTKCMSDFITATLLSPEVRRNERDLCTLTEADVTVAEDIVKALQPLKVLHLTSYSYVLYILIFVSFVICLVLPHALLQHFEIYFI